MQDTVEEGLNGPPVIGLAYLVLPLSVKNQPESWRVVSSLSLESYQCLTLSLMQQHQQEHRVGNILRVVVVDFS